MNRPIDSLNTAKPADWAAKLTANSGNAQSSASSDFSRWMAQHNTAAPQASNTTPQSSANPVKNTAEASALEARSALARAQANAAQAKRQTPVVKAETPHAPKADKLKASTTSSADANKAPASSASANAKADAAKGKAKDGTTAKTVAKDDAVAKPADTATTEAADTQFVTATGEGSALVKELQQPETVASGDASSMLAWLANLTQGDVSPKGTLPEGGEAKPGAEDASAAQLGMNAMLKTGEGRPDAGAGLAAGRDKGAAGAIDVSAMQAAEGRLATLPDAVDPSAKGLDFASTLSTEMLRGMAGKTSEAHAATPQASATLPTAVNSPEFPQALADRVGMWVKATGEDGTLSAELHLNPAEMGPISVKISLDGQSAQVDFAAANLETRRAIEASLPALSASLDDAGFSLGGSGVSDQPPQQQFGQAPGQPGGAPSWGGASGLDASQDDPLDGRVRVAPQPGRLGGLDLYA